MNSGRGRGKVPLANWMSVIKECRHGIFIQQTPQEEEIAIVPPTSTHKIVHTGRVQTYDKIPAPVRPRHPLSNWPSIRLGDNPNRPTTDEITQAQLQWNMFHVLARSRKSGMNEKKNHK